MKKVLFIAFTPIQIELVKKFIAIRGMQDKIAVVTEQERAMGEADAYAVNGDDPSAQARLSLHLRVNPNRVLGVGARAVLGVTTFASGPFKPATTDRLFDMLYGTPALGPVVRAAAMAAPRANVVSFPGMDAVQQAEVLVVDDSEIVRRTMVRKINEYGHRVDVAMDGDDAMAMLLNNRYKLVFLDVMMPGTDGFEVCKRLKKSQEYKSSAIYMLTSKDGMFDKVRGSMAGCDGYLVKPLESRKLRAVLNKHFDEPSFATASDMMSSDLSPGGLNAAEQAALDGYPAKVAPRPEPVAEPQQPEFKTTFAPTQPGMLLWRDSKRFEK
jgi:CheY-like chemotaxis protein